MSDSDIRVIPTDVADRVLARAGELEVRRGDAVPVSRLRESAAAAGIAPDVFEAALAEVVAEQRVASRRVPWWVRLGMVGVTDRRAAMIYYWFFAVMLLLSPALIPLIPARSGGARLVLPLLFAGWAFGSLWSTARVIRWLDRHGWDALP